MSRAFNQLLSSQQGINIDFQRELFCAQPQRFHRHVRAHVAAMAPHGFTAAAVGALTASDARLLLRDPDWPAVQFEMLRAFFAPYGDAPATIARMTKGLRASLPAVVPGATPAVDTTPEYQTSCRDLVCAQSHARWPRCMCWLDTRGLETAHAHARGGRSVCQRRGRAARVHAAAEAADEPHSCAGTSSARRRCWRRAAAWTTCSQHAAVLGHFKLRVRVCSCGSGQGVLLHGAALRDESCLGLDRQR